MDQSTAKRHMLFGGMICAVGLIITIGSYSAAQSGGGRYFMAWGAIIFGAIRFFRGLAALSSSNDRE